VVKEKTRSNFFLATIFLLILFIPPFIMAVMNNSNISRSENRKLTKFPQLKLEKASIKAFPGQFEAFLKDHLGFRNTIIYCHNYIKVMWLRISPVSNIITGQKNWLFYTGDFEGDIIEDYRGIKPFNTIQLEAWNDLLEKKRRWLASYGIKYLFVMSPNKHSIYPEFLPDNLNKISADTRLNQLSQFVNQHGREDIFLDLRPPLINFKNTGLVYYPTDTHWNGRGAFIAYRSIIDRLRGWFPEIDYIPVSVYSRTIKKGPGKGLARMLNLTNAYAEDEVTYRLEPFCANNIKFDELKDILPPLIQSKSFAKGCKKASLRAVVFRDSFFIPIVDLLSEHFEQVVYVWDWYDKDTMKKLIRIVNPDIVIEEHVERFLYTQFSPVADLNKEGKSLLEQGKILEAVIAFRKAQKLNPNHPEMNNTLGYALLLGKKYNEALTYFRKTLQINPNHEHAKKNLELCMKRIRKIESELAKIVSSLKTDPTNYLLYNRAGILSKQIGDIQSAVIFFIKALSIKPDSVPVLNNMGMLHADVGNYDKAVIFFNKVIKLEPNRMDMYYNLACMYSKMGKSREAVKFMKDAIQKGYDNWYLIENERDLDNIRNTAFYKRIMSDKLLLSE